MSELEEIEREDNFRLKRFKELKIKKTKGKEEPNIKASGNPCDCSGNVKPKATISVANVCTAIYEEDIAEEEQDEIESKLKEICSICKTDQEELKSSFEVTDDRILDKDLCNICNNLIDSENTELGRKINKGICSKCEIQENNKTELNKTVKSENICPTCANEEIAKKDDKFSKNILGEGECLYCKNREQTDKLEIQGCKECQLANTKSDAKNIIYDKRAINSANLCPGCVNMSANQCKDMSKNTLGKEECMYCKKKEETENKPKIECSACANAMNSEKETRSMNEECLYCKNKKQTLETPKESCQYCNKTKSIVFIDQRDLPSPTESTLAMENKTKEKNNLCSSCKKAEFDKNKMLATKEKCQYCGKNEPTVDKPKIEECQKCQNDKKITNTCTACSNQAAEKVDKLIKITPSKNGCISCGKKEETIDKSKIKNIADDKNSCQFCGKTTNIEFIDQREIISPTRSTLFTENVTKNEMNLCTSCKKTELSKTKNIEFIDQREIISPTGSTLSTENVTKDEMNLCTSCKKTKLSKTKNIEFIDQREIISPTGSTLFTENVTKDDMKLCTNCKKTELSKAEPITNSGLCQSCDKNITKSDSKTEGLCSDCKNKNNKVNSIDKKNSKTCSTCQLDNVNKCECNKSSNASAAKNKKAAKNNSKCSTCGKKSSKEIVTTDIPSYKNDNNDTSDAIGTFKEVVKIKRFSGTDGITHEHITVTSKKTQKRVLSEPACCDNNKNKSLRETKSDIMSLNKRNGILKASGNIDSVPSSDICLSCSSKKNISGKSSKDNFSDFGSITSQSFSCTPPLNSKKKNTNSCTSCNNASSAKTNKKHNNQDIGTCNSCADNNSYSKVKIVIKDDKCKDNSDEEEIELTPSTIVILKKILSRTSKSTDSCKAFEKEDNKMTESKCSCGAQTSLKTKSVKSEPCMMKNSESVDKQICGTCGSRSTKSKQSKNKCNKCQKDTPDMSTQSTPTSSCQECNKKKKKEESNCDCNKKNKDDKEKCSCSKKQSVTIKKACKCNSTTSKSSSVESKYSHCSGETSSIANQTCLMDRLGKSNSSTCTCNENKSAANKLRDECPCSKQNQPQAVTGTCSCQSVNKNALRSSSSGGCTCGKKNLAQTTTGSCSCRSSSKNVSNSSSADKSGDCSCKSAKKDEKDGCPCSKKNQPQIKNSTCSCKSVNKNAHSCMRTNKSQECPCSSTREKDECQCAKIKSKTSTCSCSSVNKTKQDRGCSCKSLKKKIEESESSCPCRKTKTKEQNICGKQESKGCSCNKEKIKTDTQKCSCSQSGKSLKTNVKFENEPQKSLCPCKSSESGQKTNSCSCKTESKSIKPCGKEDKEPSTCACQKPKTPLISPTPSNQSTTVGIQTCCLPEDKPEKCIKFSDKAAFTPNFMKSASPITPMSPKSSYVSLKSRSSQMKTSQCSCGRRDASTMTRRSDRYDVRTLRQLSFLPEPKTSACFCKSDSALLKNCKPKNVNPLGRSQSLSNQCCSKK